MAGCSIVINQAGKPAGVAGRAREDLVTGTAVTVAAVGGPFLAYSWTFQSVAENIIAGVKATSLFATPAASSSLISPIDQPGTFLVQLEVDSGSGLGATEADVASITFYAGPALNADPTLLPRRIPAFRERLQHNVPDAIDPSGNTEGWSREWLRWFAFIETLAASIAPVSPLSDVHFVDQGTAVVVGNDGAITKPWGSASLAIAALPNNATPHAILVTPADYSPEGLIAAPVGFVGTAAFQGLGEATAQTILPSLTFVASLTLVGITTGNLITSGTLITRNAIVGGVEAFNLDLHDTSVGAILCDGGSFFSEDGTHSDNIFTSGTLLTFRNCKFTVPMTFTFTGAAGIVDMDEESYRSAITAGAITVTNGAIDFPKPQLDQITLAAANDDLDFGVPIAWRLCTSAAAAQSGLVSTDHINGLLAPGPNEPAFKTILFTSGIFGPIDVINEAGTSAPANRILTTTGGAVVVCAISSTGIAHFIYDFVASRWRLFV
jgi:hypothetical protein